MDRQSIFQALEIIVQERGGLRRAIRPDARFKEDLEIDSLLVVDIVVDIEKKFAITLPDAELVNVSTLDAATSLVLRLLSPSGGGRGGAEEESLQPLPLRVVRDLT
jgi:acyl carrier protein